MMTEKNKTTILEMRAAGKSYKEISAVLGINASALKAFVSRHRSQDNNPDTLKAFVHRHSNQHNNPDNDQNTRKCIFCGRGLSEDARTNQRFCSTKCKNAWWKAHPNQIESEKRAARSCLICGRPFVSYNADSKYCSRTCYYASKRK